MLKVTGPSETSLRYKSSISCDVSPTLLHSEISFTYLYFTKKSWVFIPAFQVWETYVINVVALCDSETVMVFVKYIVVQSQIITSP